MSRHLPSAAATIVLAHVNCPGGGQHTRQISRERFIRPSGRTPPGAAMYQKRTKGL
jgi:hypothetical protein